MNFVKSAQKTFSYGNVIKARTWWKNLNRLDKLYQILYVFDLQTKIMKREFF